MVRTILFDMGNVLVYFSHELMCAQIGALCEKSESEIRRLLLDSGLQWRFERGRISETEFHREFEEAAGCSVQLSELIHAGSDIFEANEQIPPLLEELRGLKHRLVLLSNTSISHFEHVRSNFDVLDHFDDFVLSYEVGSLKPDPEIFHAAAEVIGCDPAECFFTDDIEANVEAARRFGLDAEVFTGVGATIEQLRRRDVELTLPTG